VLPAGIKKLEEKIMNLVEILLLPLAVVAMLTVPFIGYWQKKKGNNSLRKALAWNLGSFFAIMIAAIVLPVGDLLAYAYDNSGAVSMGAGLGYLAAALSTGIGSIGCGIAVGGAAPAAIGATAEDPKSFAKSLIFVALGEGVAIYGLVISIMIINALG
jgi:V/A-type H+-transporting ATPase subunit K